MLEEEVERRGEAVAALRPFLLRTIADVQHRLTFRAQAFIKASACETNQSAPQQSMAKPLLLNISQQCSAFKNLN